MTRRAISRALVSVYDKSGLDELATALHKAGVEIVSTGSTAAAIAAAGVPVTPVEQVTGFPECLGGRVKTLHPGVHAGLLADAGDPEHVSVLASLGIAPFQLLVSNLYPFEQTVVAGADFDQVIEQIDIGGPAMVRAAAKNHGSVAVVTSPDAYDLVVGALAEGGFTLPERRRLAARAYALTASYDAAVASWFASSYAPDETASESGWPEVVAASWVRQEVLRYGENPHQGAALYLPAGGRRAAGAPGGAAGAPGGAAGAPGGAAGAPGGAAGAPGRAAGAPGRAAGAPGGAGGAVGGAAGVATAEQVSGKAMSYNNYVDADAAWRAVYSFDRPCVAIMKHSNPCGIAVAADIAEAHRLAHACDPVSAFGGVIATNRPVTVELAARIAEIFTEVIIAPDFEPEALEILRAKKNQRLLLCPAPSAAPAMEFRQVSGGLLMQTADGFSEPGDRASGWELAAGPPVGDDVLADLEFAWRACRSVKSNAILLASGGASVGIGMGQVNRVDAARLAVTRAGARADGSVAASDAYFPFPDGLLVLAEAGVQAVVEPGGSVRDPLVIEAADAAGVSLYFTGVRHFWH